MNFLAKNYANDDKARRLTFNEIFVTETYLKMIVHPDGSYTRTTAPLLAIFPRGWTEKRLAKKLFLCFKAGEQPMWTEVAGVPSGDLVLLLRFDSYHPTIKDCHEMIENKFLRH